MRREVACAACPPRVGPSKVDSGQVSCSRAAPQRGTGEPVHFQYRRVRLPVSRTSPVLTETAGRATAVTISAQRLRQSLSARSP